MLSDCVTYQNSGFFSKLIVNYLNQNEQLKSCFNRFPTLENFEFQIQEKASNFDNQKRQVLVETLLQQYQNINCSEATTNNIALLQQSSTFTITTGHQLNIFTGPVYFLYKIVSTINLCKQLKERYPIQNFVPVFWMATEDHDFDEINHFSFKNKIIKWSKNVSGPVGRLSTDGLEDVFEVFSNELGLGKDADFLRTLFRKAYLESNNLSIATRVLVNELFSESGLVIIDGDEQRLKKQFATNIKEELIQRKSFELVSETMKMLDGYKIQVNPREINLFFIDHNLRERIVFENNCYKINNTNISYSETEILEILDTNPEKFSPNVILRPLYQEVILPNLCYIGGGGELAYWFELKRVFKLHGTTFPMLLLRNSAIVVTEKQCSKMNKMYVNWEELFLKQNDLTNIKTKQYSAIELDFSVQKQFLKNQFDNLFEIVQKTDKSFAGAVLAQQKKQLNGLDSLEKRLLKAEKRKFSDSLSQIITLQNELFPNQGLQERVANFSEFYDSFFINRLLLHCKPLDFSFGIILNY